MIIKGALSINGRAVSVPNAICIAPREYSWVLLDGRDCQPRGHSWVQQGTYHTTGGIWPHRLKAGAQPNPLKRAQDIADMWRISPRGKAQSGGAHIIISGQYIVCLEDLVRVEAYHATKVNPYSYGVEMAQDHDGTIYEDTLATAVELAFVTADELGIPMQTNALPYKTNTIIERLKMGGKHDVVGFFGHRDSAWMFNSWIKDPAVRARWPLGYADRGRGDPGDEWYSRLRARGAMVFDFGKREDIAFWKPVQAALNKRGEKLVVNGVCGPETVRALRKHDLWNRGVFTEAPIL